MRQRTREGEGVFTLSSSVKRREVFSLPAMIIFALSARIGERKPSETGTLLGERTSYRLTKREVKRKRERPVNFKSRPGRGGLFSKRWHGTINDRGK